VYKHINKVHGNVDFETKYFEAVFYSHLIKMIKPQKDIYEFVQKMIGFSGSEILFLDDKIENVNAAINYGWNAIHHNPSNPIEISFFQYIDQLS
jgi:putative hydrolase of the HAD superfamily